VFFHIPTISGYFLFYDKKDIGLKKFSKFLGKKAKSAFIFLNFMVYKNGNFNCRRGERLIVVDQGRRKNGIFGDIQWVGWVG
jgi:hypothetical protein